MSDFAIKVEQFFGDLSQNNEKSWFEENRSRYESEVLDPAKEFVARMGDELHKIQPNIQAIPKTDKSLFRIHRDIRFSKNKSPYKTHLGIFFWEGERKKMECSGLYFHIEPGSFMLASGMHMIPQHLLGHYRDVVSIPKKARELDKIVKDLKSKDLEVRGRHYKKFPRGYDSDFQPNEYLLYNGVFTFFSSTDFGLLKGAFLINFVMDFFKKTLRLHNWLVENI